MKKIIVIGCPGSGKSYFSKRLNTITKLPLYHLDNMYWNSDGTTVCADVFKDCLDNTLKKDEWIIDGNYLSTMEKRMKYCDTIFFLDYPVELCLQGIEERKGKKRSDLPWIENETDEEFRELIVNFEKTNKPSIEKLLKEYSFKEIHIFKNRKEADIFLKEISILHF